MYVYMCTGTHTHIYIYIYTYRNTYSVHNYLCTFTNTETCVQFCMFTCINSNQSKQTTNSLYMYIHTHTSYTHTHTHTHTPIQTHAFSHAGFPIFCTYLYVHVLPYVVSHSWCLAGKEMPLLNLVCLPSVEDLGLLGLRLVSKP